VNEREVIKEREREKGEDSENASGATLQEIQKDDKDR
jgi:hypothetical protein